MSSSSSSSSEMSSSSFDDGGSPGEVTRGMEGLGCWVAGWRSASVGGEDVWAGLWGWGDREGGREGESLALPSTADIPQQKLARVLFNFFPFGQSSTIKRLLGLI